MLWILSLDKQKERKRIDLRSYLRELHSAYNLRQIMAHSIIIFQRWEGWGYQR